MKIRASVCSLSVLVLAACARLTAEKDVSSSSSVRAVGSNGFASSQVAEGSQFRQESTPSDAPQSPEVDFNGLYYSVQGKYDEIIIVNKKHPLSREYAPGEIPEALSAFQAIVAKMQSLDYDVSSTSYSGFRSYETQESLYQSYVANDGKDNADRYSARAGYSEHQTGLAYDIIDSNGSLLTNSDASKWLAENAHYYGFIVRYPPEKETSTGYMPESWHIRYIGKEASDIYQSGQTLEEYFDVSGGDYEN